MVENPDYRAGFVAGVRATLDHSIVHMPPPAVLELEEWLEELLAWRQGPMPAAPMYWPAAAALVDED